MQRILLLLYTYRVYLLWLGLELVGFAFLLNHRAFQRFVVVRELGDFGAEIHGFRSEVHDYFFLSETNQVLADQNAALLAKIHLLQAESAQNPNVYIPATFQWYPAEVIHHSVTSERNYFVLNRGTAAGMAPLMGVVNADGVVGVIESCTKNHSTGLSFLNRELRVNARIRGSHAHGLANWSGGSLQSAQLLDVPKHVEISTGDTIETSGFGGIFPSGVPLGIVESVEPQPGSKFLDIRFRPAVNYHALDVVYAVKYELQEELDSIMIPLQSNQDL